MTTTKKKYAAGEGYLFVKRKLYVNEDGIPLPINKDDEFPCVMCGGWGYVVAPETGEILCGRCKLDNDEAREKQ